MKRNRTGIFIAVSCIALVIVLIIQVKWILETARVKEELFNEKANIILTRTSEALTADKETCRNLEAGVGKNEIAKIDSLIRYYMDFYNFRIGYTFEVVRRFPGSPEPLVYGPVAHPDSVAAPIPAPTEPACGGKNLKEIASRNGFALKLLFPEKEAYIRAEIGTPFIASVILIIIVLILFWRTTVSLRKEKEISEHTTDFLNNMTHEFKTPLTNIALAGRMITKDPQLKQDDKIRHYSGIILGENEKLRLQVEQVLSMTALERGEIPLQKTEIDLHLLIRDAVKCMSLQIENRQGSIHAILDAERFVINGDSTHLTNAICNLLDNAIKYSREKPELSVQTSNQEHSIVVIVSDKGIGIDKEHQKKVFGKFYRVPTGDVHDVKGFGLGLAYVKKIIRLHDGTIELSSERGKGTTFTITLPYA